MFCERTWKDVTTPNESGYCPLEGDCRPPDPERRKLILELLENPVDHPGVEFLVFVQCLLLDSSQAGKYELIKAGPGFTWTAAIIEEMKAEPMKYFFVYEGQDTVARLYPQWYLSRANHLLFEGKSHAQVETKT